MTRLQQQFVVSSQLIRNFKVIPLNYLKYVNILSEYDEKILVSSLNLAQLFVYSRDGHHLLSIPTNDNDTLQDAMWTSFGNIIYTTTNSRKVVLISESGKFIADTLMTNPQYLSISSDNLIYLADSQTGIYESKNDGVSWKLFL